MAAPDNTVELAMRTAKNAAETASSVLREHFDRGVTVQAKTDGSPVTEADLAAEKAILHVLRSAFPNSPIVTEESGNIPVSNGNSDAPSDRWIVDPLDGTGRFARGMRFWGPLIAYEIKGEIAAGAMAMPAVNECYWAGRQLGAWRNGERLAVSTLSDWSEAIFAVGGLQRALCAPFADNVTDLLRTCSYANAGGDLSGASLVLSGQAEAWLEVGVCVWDTAPMKILVEEAGGTFTDLTGHPAVGKGTAILISNGTLHEHALSTLVGDA